MSLGQMQFGPVQPVTPPLRDEAAAPTAPASGNGPQLETTATQSMTGSDLIPTEEIKVQCDSSMGGQVYLFSEPMLNLGHPIQPPGK